VGRPRRFVDRREESRARVAARQDGPGIDIVTSARRLRRRDGGTFDDMKLMRTVAVAGIAKKLYDESRKPENQRRIKQAVESVKARRAGKHTR
jgi:hypothetical protein